VAAGLPLEAVLDTLASSTASLAAEVDADQERWLHEAVDAPPSWAVPYVRGQADRVHCPHPRQSKEARPHLRRYFEQLIGAVTPVHENLLTSFRTQWSVGRVGHVIKDNIRAALARATVGGLPGSRDAAGFYRVEDRPFTGIRVPVDADRIRPVALVPPRRLKRPYWESSATPE
jgi:hypothetical protein